MRGTVFEASEESRDSEGTHSSLLGVLLLSFGHKASDVFNRRRVFVVEAEGLALEAGFVDQNTGISLESSESEHKVLVEALDFANSARVLELGDRVFLNGEHDTVSASDTDGGTATVDGLEGVLHLEELTIRGKDGDSFIVRRHKSERDVGWWVPVFFY